MLSGIAVALPAFATSVASSSSSTTTTTVSSKIPPLYIQGHSPVDLLLVVLNAAGQPTGQMIGCASEPCVGLIVFKGWPKPGTGIVDNLIAQGGIFTGPTGAGCDSEETLVPETLSVLYPTFTKFELILLPSWTYFASTGPGCLIKHTTTTTMNSYNYNVDLCTSLSANGNCNSPIVLTGGVQTSCTSSTLTTTTAGAPCVTYTQDYTLGPGGISVTTPAAGVPEFPYGGLASIITVAVVMLVVVRLMLVARKDLVKLNVRSRNATITRRA